MADRGFEIEEDLPPGVLLNIPPFFGDQPQFSEPGELPSQENKNQENCQTQNTC